MINDNTVREETAAAPESQVGPRVVNPMPAKVACEAALGMLMRGLDYPTYQQVITDADMDRSEKLVLVPVGVTTWMKGQEVCPFLAEPFMAEASSLTVTPAFDPDAGTVHAVALVTFPDTGTNLYVASWPDADEVAECAVFNLMQTFAPTVY